MARRNGPRNLEEDADSPIAGLSAVADYSTGGDDAARFSDLEPEEQSPFLRAQKRVPVRRGSLPRKTAHRLKSLAGVLAIAAASGLAGASVYSYAHTSWRFRIDSSDQIEVRGNHNVTRSQVLEVFGGDISRNIFSIPLTERRHQLEQIPWVGSATVMRLLPNRLSVEVRERAPVAFVKIGSRIALADDAGVVMDLPAGASTKYSFPVILGFGGNEPQSTRAARMKIYGQLIGDLDSSGAHYSLDLSEVDLTDPEDVKVTVSDSSGGVLIHLGASNFLDRFKVYVAHVQEWRQQFAKLNSVDLRYDRQVILNPDSPAPEPRPTAPAALTVPGAKAAAHKGTTKKDEKAVKAKASVQAKAKTPGTTAAKPAPPKIKPPAAAEAVKLPN